MILGVLGMLAKLGTNKQVIGSDPEVGQNIIFILYMISFTNIDFLALVLLPRHRNK